MLIVTFSFLCYIIEFLKVLTAFTPPHPTPGKCKLHFCVFSTKYFLSDANRRSLKLTVLLLSFEQTGVALGAELDDKMPQHEYYEYFGPDYTLHVAPSNMENKNSRQQLDEIRSGLLENLSKLQHAPSVQFQERPPDTELAEVCFCI